MKKVIKILALISVVAMLAVTFCSCDRLDELKARHAKWIEPGESFEFDDDEYMKVGITDSVSYVSTYNHYDIGINITADDVPVLLSDQFGIRAMYDSDNDIVYYGNTIYTTEDNYEYVKNIITSPRRYLDNYGAYLKYSKKNGSTVYEFAVVDSELKAALDNALEANRNPDEAEAAPRLPVLCGKLYYCDARGLFMSNSYLNIYQADGNYYISDLSAMSTVSIRYTKLDGSVNGLMSRLVMNMDSIMY